MPSWSSANLLDLATTDSNFPLSPHHPAHLPCVMADPCILSTTGVTDGDSLPAMPERRIIVSHHLPLCVTPDPIAHSGWSFFYDPGDLVLQLRSGLLAGAKVLQVGTLYGLLDGLDPTHHDAVVAHLYREFYCIPILLPPRPLLPWLL